MAPIHSRQLLVWSLPTLAVLLSYLWYRKRRIGAQSDPGETYNSKALDEVKPKVVEKAVVEELSTPVKSFSRSLSGVESTPIDIVIPPNLRASKSTPIVISDEDLDFEIEKIKSMRNGSLFPSKIETTSPVCDKPKSQSPIIENNNKSNNKKNRKETRKMAQKEMAAVEEKLDAIRLTNNKNSPDKKDKTANVENNTDHQSSERDSANHSPSDTMMASPSLSSISDNHSEGSNDSGKGGSDLATPPPSRTPGIEDPESIPSFYEFAIPQSLVGKLIGRHGSSIAHIREKTNVMIIVKKHPTNPKLKICSVEGAKKDVDKALKIIREKFPTKRYPEITLEQLHLPPLIPTIPLTPDHLYLKLVEGINNDTILSCMVAPNHLFLQQPTHPSYPSLNVLTNYMNMCYSEIESPLLPNPIPENTVCAAYSVDAWYRAMVLSTDTESDKSYVKFLDYGGFAYVDNTNMRQIRGDFMLLPFQGAECILANIRSLDEDGSWPEEAYNLVADITKGAIIYTQVADYTDDGVPLVLCYVVLGNSCVVFLNQHLVDNGFAEWLSMEGDAQQAVATTSAETMEPIVATVQVQ